MTREEMIIEMIEDDLRMVRDNQNNDDWLVDILREGFIGYENETDKEIIREYKERFETE